MTEEQMLLYIYACMFGSMFVYVTCLALMMRHILRRLNDLNIGLLRWIDMCLSLMQRVNKSDDVVRGDSNDQR